MDATDGGGGGSLNIAPLRPLEDFLTGRARFQACQNVVSERCQVDMHPDVSVEYHNPTSLNNT